MDLEKFRHRMDDPWLMLLCRDEPPFKHEVVKLLEEGVPPPPEALNFLAEIISGRKKFPRKRPPRLPKNKRFMAAMFSWQLEYKFGKYLEEQGRTLNMYDDGCTVQDWAIEQAAKLHSVDGRTIRNWRKEVRALGLGGIEGFRSMERVFELSERELEARIEKEFRRREK